MDETRIDTLTIEIGASSTKAVSELDKVAESMRRLQTTAKQGISNSFKQSIDALSRIDTSGLTNLASALKSLQDATRISVSSKLGDFISALSGALKSVQSEDISKLRQISYALSGLKNVGDIRISRSLPDNIELLAVAAGSITPQTATALTELGNALNSFSGVKQINISKDFPDRLRSLMLAADAANPGALAGVAYAVNQMSVIGSIRVPKNLAQFIIDIAQASLLISEQGLANLERITAALSNLSGVDLRGVGSAIGRASKATPEAPKVPKTSGTEDAESKSGGLLGWLKEVSARTKERFKIKVDAKDADKASKKIGLLTRTLNALKRIAFYRLIRTAIKAIGDAFREGQENAYWYSKTVGEETKYISEAYDSLSSASFKMKNQLGASWATLRTAITPVLLEIVSLVTRAANAITQFFAVLSGESTYLRAIDYAKDWADETDKGSKAAKEWKNQLLGFDEINRLNEPSSGGGGASALPDYENMFEEAKVEGMFSRIAEKFNKLKESIDFGPIKESLKELKESFSGLGSTIEEGLGWAWDNIFAPLILWVVEKALPVIADVVGAVVEVVNAIAERLGPAIQKVWDSLLKPIAIFIGQTIINLLNNLKDILLNLADLISGKKSFSEFWSSLSETQRWLSIVLGAIVLVSGVKGILGLGTAFLRFVSNPATRTIAILAAIVVGGTLLIQNWEKIKTKLGQLGEKFKETWGNGKIEAEDFGYVAITVITKVMEAAEKLLGTIKDLVEVLGLGKNNGSMIGNVLSKLGLTEPIQPGSSPENGIKITKRDPIGVSNSSTHLSGKFGDVASDLEDLEKLLAIRGWATGGFPEDGLFFANSGELVGKFANGRTAVANNEQIEAGIARAVYSAVVDALGQNGGGNGDDRAVNIYLDGKQIAQTTTRYQRQFARVGNT